MESDMVISIEGVVAVNKYDRSIVASGHQLVSEAAGKILDAGGNAFDAVVAAGFASVAAEPALNSLGGVHAVIPGVEGAGDPRRGGSVVTVYHNENGL